MGVMLYKNRQQDIILLTTNKKKLGTEKKVVDNISQRPDIRYVQSGMFLATLNTACRWSKVSAKKDILSIAKVVTFEATTKLWGMED